MRFGHASAETASSLSANRAAALMFLTDPESALLILVRAITALDDKALRLQARDAARSRALRRSTEMMEAAVIALLRAQAESGAQHVRARDAQHKHAARRVREQARSKRSSEARRLD